MSLYDSLGEVTFSINDPTLTKNPPFKYTRAIAYNGNYWLAAGTIVVRDVTVKSFTDVIAAEFSAESAVGYYKNQGTYNTPTAKTEIQAYLDQAKEIFTRYKGLNYVPQTFHKYSVHCFAKSTDGFNWKYVEECPFVDYNYPGSSDRNPGTDNPKQVRGLVWNGSKWMAVGIGSLYVTNPNNNYPSSPRIATSTDGDTWDFYNLTGLSVTYPITQFFNDNINVDNVHSVTCDTTRWMIGTNAGIWKQAFNSSTWTLLTTPSTIKRTKILGVATNGTTIVGVGEFDGYTNNVYGDSSLASAIISSTDNGVTWASRLVYETTSGGYWATRTTFNAVAWNGDKWVAVGKKQTPGITEPNVTGIIAVSEDGVDWTTSEGFSSGLSCVSWDGNEWLVGSSNGNILVSRDGLQWKPTDSDTSGVLAVGTPIVLPILGGDINTVQSLLVGSGTPTSILRTYDDATWIQQLLTDQKKYRAGDTPAIINSVVWSGTKWVMTGSQALSKTIMVSDNGIDWVYPTTTLQKGNGVAYNDGLYVAVGEGISTTGRIATSTDAVTWTARTSPIKTLNCVASNGTIWVSGGNGGILYSSNGTTWTKSTTCPLTKVNGVAWNGYYWVAAGIGPTCIFALSKDGMRWYAADAASSSYLREANSVAWNGTLWLGVGLDQTNCILYSNDGYTWGFLPQKNLTNGIYVAWTGTKWLVSGNGNSSIISSTDAENWSEYPNTLTTARCFCSKSVTLPLIGTSSSTVLAAVTAVLNDLTTKTNATIAEEEAAAKLAEDQAAQAALLARRNAIKAEADIYLTRMTYWKTTVNTQFTPLTITTYVDLKTQSSTNYGTANSIVNTTLDTYASVEACYEIIYNDSNLITKLEDTLDLIKSKVRQCEQDLKTFYNTIRVLYTTLANSTYSGLVPTNMYDDLYYTYNFPTQIRNSISTFYLAKTSALSTLKTAVTSACNTAVTDIVYSAGSSNAPDYATLYKAITAIDTDTLYSATYATDGSNPYYYLTIINSLYPKILATKIQCNGYVTDAQTMANNWADVLEVSHTSITSNFDSLYTKYFYTLGDDFIPTVPDEDIPNKKIVLTDIPIRAFKALADTFAHPISYPTALQTLYTRLKETTDSVESTRQAAVDYMVNKRKTTIKDKLDNIYKITKTKYTDQLSLDTNLSEVTGILYNKNSDYQYCINLLKLLKSGYVLYPTFKEKYLAVDLADIAAEEDGCVPPSSGWGTTVRKYVKFDVDLETRTFQIVDRGERYLLNDSFKILGTQFVGGSSPANDITVNILDVGDLDGKIVNFSKTGTLPSSKTYTGISGTRFQNASVTFNVTPSGSGYTVSLVNGGSGYSVGQTILLKGSDFFRTSGTNDITVTVTDLTTNDAVRTFTSTGSSVLSTIDDINSYRNCSAKFTFLSSNPGGDPGKNFNILLTDPGTIYSTGDVITIGGDYLGGTSPKNDVTITVGSVNSNGGIVDFTYLGTPSTSGVSGQTEIQKQNTSATFTFSNITSSSSFTCSVKNAGTGYVAGDRLIILGSSFSGGKTPANDFRIKVLTTTTTGGISTFSVTSGNFGFLFQTYNRTGNVIEQNATFDIVSTFYQTPGYAVTLNNPGNGYSNGEQITIYGKDLDGDNTTNDLTITVQSVTGGGGISTFTSSGTPKTVFRIDTKPTTVDSAYVVGRPGLHGWEKYNYTFTVRNDIANYITQNGVLISTGNYWTFKNPGILLGEGISWREFLNFTKTTTYTSLLDKITGLEDKVDALTTANKLTTSYIDSLVTADLAAIQAKYEPFAIAYTQKLLSEVGTNIPSAKFLVQATGQTVNGVTTYTYSVALSNSGYGYTANEELTFAGTLFGGSAPTNNLVIKILTVNNLGKILTFQKKSGTPAGLASNVLVTNNKLVDRFSQLATAQTTIEANYSTLLNAPGSITGKTNSEIQVIVNNAVKARNAIVNIQNGGYLVDIKSALRYLEYYNIASTTVSTLNDDLIRWFNMKNNAIASTPYITGTLSRGVGDPFIMSIVPTNTDYWLERTYPTYTLTRFGNDIYECTLNEDTGKIETSVSTPISLSDVSQYLPSKPYTVGNYVKYNDEIYKCILDNSPAFLSTNTQDGVKGVTPNTNSGAWRVRKYPNVTINDEEQEYSENLSTLINPDYYKQYESNFEYGISTVVRDGNDVYYCRDVIVNDSLLIGVVPTNTNYWVQISYPIVTTLDGVNLEANPSSFTAVNPSTLTDVTAGNVYKSGDFGKSTIGFVDDSGYYREGTQTFQLDQDTESLLSKGYPPVYYYDSTHKYQNASMWQHVQDGIKTGLTVLSNSYSSTTVYKKGDYAIYNGSFYYPDGTLSTTGYHTFVLISPYLSDNPQYSNRAKGPLLEIKSNFPLATKSKGNLPTTTPWLRLESVSQNDSTPTYSSSQTYVTDDIVKYTDGATTYKYKFVGTLPLYNSGTIGYAFFGTVASNKSGWAIRSYPAVYYDGELVDPTTVPALDPNDFPAYNSQDQYPENTTVSYNGSIYRTRYAKINYLIGVPVTNTNYWTKVRYQLLIYDGDDIEATPGSIPLLDSDDFLEYDPNETYYTGDIIKLTETEENLNLNNPLDVVTSSNGNIYVINRGTNIIKQVKFDSNLEPIVVNVGQNIYYEVLQVSGYLSHIADGTTVNATYSNNLTAIAVDDLTDTIYFSDSSYIRKITSSGTVTKVTQGGLGYLDGNISQAKFGIDISGLIFDKNSNCLYVSDTINHRIRKIDIATGVVSTLAGSDAGLANGTGTAAKFNYPRGIDIDSNGNLYVADSSNNCIRKVTPQGAVTTIAGIASDPGHVDGNQADARFKAPYGIAIDSDDYIYVSEPSNHCIRRISPNVNNRVTITFAGSFTENNQPISGNFDSYGPAAKFNSPHGMSFDKYNNLYVADALNNKIRKIRTDTKVLSAVKDKATIYECITNCPVSIPIVNVVPTNTRNWEKVTHQEVYIDDVPVQADPDNTVVFAPLNQYDYARYDNNWMYKYGDRVSYNGKIYECINADPVGDENISLSGIDPPNDIYWELVNNSEPLGTGINGAKSWYIGKPYKVGDVVYYLKKIYKCAYEHTGNTNDLPNRLRRWQRYTKPTTTVIPIWSDSSVSYKVDDIVVYNSKKYICLVAHTSESAENPERIMKWEVSDQSTASNIVFWELNVQYLADTVLVYNGYFYRCEVSHYSTYDDSPEENKFYWSKITDLTDVGLPGYYDSEASYFVGDIVTTRVINKAPPTHYESFVYSTFTTATSTNGIDWVGSQTTPFSSDAKAAAWNGSFWILAGSGNATLAKSTDGINWTAISNPFTVAAYGVAWNGTMWIAVGEGSATIATSTDGDTWTARTNPLNLRARDVAWNGEYWLAVGSGEYIDGLFTDQISKYRYIVAKSTDGITWTVITYNPDPNWTDTDPDNVFPIKTVGNSIVWGQSKWVLAGSGINYPEVYSDYTTIVTSTDSVTWPPRTNPLFFNATRVKWNGTIWVAVGQGSASIATSTDGITWVPRKSPFEAGTGVDWNGSYWIAVGQLDYTTMFAISTDGITWTRRDSIFVNNINGIVWNGTTWLMLGGKTTATTGIVSEVPNQESVHTIEFYKCIKSNVDYPSKYTYDDLVILPSKDGLGNYQTARIAGTWRKNNLPRYGSPEDDPFRISGFAGELRRRVWMEIEMPYKRLSKLTDYNFYRERYDDDYMMETAFSFVTESFRPTDYQTDYDTIKDAIIPIIDSFVASDVGYKTYPDGTPIDLNITSSELSIDQLILRAYENLTNEIIRVKSRPFEVNTANISTQDDEYKCIDQLVSEINTMKTQYFNNPGTQAEIRADPYKFMNAIALAQNPPKKLFRDLGVGDVDEITQYLRTHPPTFANFGTGKYTEQTLKQAKEANEILESKLELISLRCHEIKLKLGVAVAFQMLATTVKPGAQVICDSGEFDLPIGDWNTLDAYQSPPTGGLIDALFSIINAGCTPPEYTLPTSQATRDLANLTYEVQNVEVKGLTRVAKGLVGFTAALFEGRANILGQLVNGIASIHAMVLESSGKEVDRTTAETIAITNTNFAKFNRNDESILLLKQQINYYKNAVGGSYLPVSDNVSLEQKIILLARIGLLLRKIELYKRQLEYNWSKQPAKPLPDVVQVPSQPTQVVVKRAKPPPVETNLRETLAQLEREAQQLRQMQTPIRNKLIEVTSNSITIPPFVPDITKTVEEAVTKIIPVDPPPPKYVNEIKNAETALKQQNEVVQTLESEAKNAQTGFDLADTDYKYKSDRVTAFRDWYNLGIEPDSKFFPITITETNGTTVTYNSASEVVATNSRKQQLRNVAAIESERASRLQQSREAALKVAKDRLNSQKINTEKLKSNLSELLELESKYLEQHKANNPAKTVTEYVTRETTPAERAAQMQEQLKRHEIEVSKAKAQQAQKAALEADLTNQLDDVNQSLQKNATEKELIKKEIELENERSIKEAGDEYVDALSDQAETSEKLDLEIEKRRVLQDIIPKANNQRITALNQILTNTDVNIGTLTTQLDLKISNTASKLVAFETKIYSSSKITGNWVVKFMKPSAIATFADLQNTLIGTLAEGDVPYKIEELVMGQYFYDKLSPEGKARIDAISTQLNAIDEPLTTIEIQLITTKAEKFTTYQQVSKTYKVSLLKVPKDPVNSLKYFSSTLTAKPLSSRPNSLIKGINAITKGATLLKSRIGNSIMRILSPIIRVLTYPPVERFLAGLGAALEVGGAALAAWQGGAFSEGETLGL